MSLLKIVLVYFSKTSWRVSSDWRCTDANEACNLIQRSSAFVCHNYGSMITCALSSQPSRWGGRGITLYVMIRQSIRCTRGSETRKSGFLFGVHPVDMTLQVQSSAVIHFYWGVDALNVVAVFASLSYAAYLYLLVNHFAEICQLYRLN